MTWNDTDSLTRACATCGAAPGEWCVYPATVTGKPAPWADPAGTRNQARNHAGQRCKRLHNARRPKFDENGRCRAWQYFADRQVKWESDAYRRCEGTREGWHFEGCPNAEADDLA